MGNFVGIFIGGWTDGDDWTATHANWVQDSVTKTINASDGSAHAPTSAIEIAAAGLVLTDVVSIVPDDGTATFADGAIVVVSANGTWTFAADSEIDMADGSVLSLGGSVGVQGTAAIEVFSGATISLAAGSITTVLGDIDIGSGGTLDLNSGSVQTVKSGAALTCAAGSAATLAGTNTISGATTVSGAVTRTSKETRSGTGARTVIRQNTLTDVSATLSVDYDHYRYVQTNGVNHTLTLAVTTAPVPTAGEVISILVLNTAGAGLVSIRSEGAASVMIQSDYNFTCSAIFDGAAWRLKSFGEASTHITVGAG